MVTSFRQLDQILRGEATQLSKLREGQIQLPVRGLCLAVTILAMVYGMFMGSFALIRTGGTGEAWMQLLASTIKLPLLFASSSESVGSFGLGESAKCME